MSPLEWLAIKFAKHEVKKYLGGNMDIKEGWKTTEFWSAHLTQIVSLMATILALVKLNLTPQQQEALVVLGGAIITVVQVFYTKGRTDIKVAQIQASVPVTDPAPSQVTTVNTVAK